MTDDRTTGRLQGDDGQVGGIEVLPFGLLIFVVGALLVINAWAVVDCKFAVDAASREGARAYVEATGRDAARELAVRRAEEAVAAHGRTGPVTVLVALDGDTYRRCGRVTVTARYAVPAITLPFLGPRGEGLTVSSEHSELIDPYRSGLPGAAAC